MVNGEIRVASPQSARGPVSRVLDGKTMALAMSGARLCDEPCDTNRLNEEQVAKARDE